MSIIEKKTKSIVIKNNIFGFVEGFDLNYAKKMIFRTVLKDKVFWKLLLLSMLHL